MYYDNRKSWNNGIDTAQLVEFLKKKGFHFESKQYEYGCPNERWHNYANDMFCTIMVDYDPFMHIDETDDDICYDTPYYVYVDYVDYWDPVCVTNLDELEEEIRRARELYLRYLYGDDYQDEEEESAAA